MRFWLGLRGEDEEISERKKIMGITDLEVNLINLFEPCQSEDVSCIDGGNVE